MFVEILSPCLYIPIVYLWVCECAFVAYVHTPPPPPHHTATIKPIYIVLLVAFLLLFFATSTIPQVACRTSCYTATTPPLWPPQPTPLLAQSLSCIYSVYISQNCHLQVLLSPPRSPQCDG